VTTAFSGNTLQALNEEFLVTSAESDRVRGFENCQAYHAIQSQLGVVFPGVPASCGASTLSQQERTEILSGNNVFPFDFTKNPISLNMGLTIPVFTGFSRQRQIEQAEAFARDAQHQRRAEELRLQTAVTESFDALQSARRVVEIEERNRAVAEERLALARQRYALGAAGVIELLDSETSMSTAERDYLNAVYQFHQALVALETATGRSLRPGAEEDAEAGGR
jgi:outer membrane protein TolC